MTTTQTVHSSGLTRQKPRPKRTPEASSVSMLQREFDAEIERFDLLFEEASKLVSRPVVIKRKKASRIDWPMFFFCLAIAIAASLSIK